MQILSNIIDLDLHGPLIDSHTEETPIDLAFSETYQQQPALEAKVFETFGQDPGIIKLPVSGIIQLDDAETTVRETSQLFIHTKIEPQGSEIKTSNQETIKSHIFYSPIPIALTPIELTRVESTPEEPKPIGKVAMHIQADIIAPISPPIKLINSTKAQLIEPHIKTVKTTITTISNSGYAAPLNQTAEEISSQGKINHRHENAEKTPKEITKSGELRQPSDKADLTSLLTEKPVTQTLSSSLETNPSNILPATAQATLSHSVSNPITLLQAPPSQISNAYFTAANPGLADAVVKAYETKSGMSLRLDPPEMGRIYIDFQFEADGAVKAIVKSDVLETMVLLKDKVEIFQQILKDNGLSNVDMHFEHDKDKQQRRSLYNREETTFESRHQEGEDEPHAILISRASKPYAPHNTLRIDLKI